MYVVCNHAPIPSLLGAPDPRSNGGVQDTVITESQLSSSHRDYQMLTEGSVTGRLQRLTTAYVYVNIRQHPSELVRQQVSSTSDGMTSRSVSMRVRQHTSTHVSSCRTLLDKNKL